MWQRRCWLLISWRGAVCLIMLEGASAIDIMETFYRDVLGAQILPLEGFLGEGTHSFGISLGVSSSRPGTPPSMVGGRSKTSSRMPQDMITSCLRSVISRLPKPGSSLKALLPDRLKTSPFQD